MNEIRLVNMAYLVELLTCYGCIITLCIHQYSLPVQYEMTTNLQLLSFLLRILKPFWILLLLCILVLGHPGKLFGGYHISPY